MRSLATILAVLVLNSFALGEKPTFEKWRTADGKEVEAAFQSFDAETGKLTILIPKTIDVQLLDADSQHKAKILASPGGFDWEAAEDNAEPYSTDQIMRLFEGTWQCSNELTLQCPWNATIQKEKLDATSSLYAVDWKQTAFFKNAGIMFTYGHNPPALVDLPYKESKKFNERVRILGRNGFSFKLDSGIWLVFVPVSTS